MKRTRPSAPSTQFGLVAWLEQTRVALPLKGVECRFEITAALACVELDQIYYQNTDRPLDCTYTFPLPAGAAVYRCELHVNGRVIRAKVEEKGAARRIFREQKAAGRRAALVETERENLFTLALGNVQPGDVIVVRFAWFQVLDRAGDGLRLLVPTCPGVRYIPGTPLLRGPSGRGTVDDTDQVPDASRITPPRIDAMHPDAAYFSINGRLSSADVEIGTASSPSHPIYVRESGDAVTVELSGRGTVPDRDFVLAWREPKTRQLAPQAWRWTESEDTYALVQLRAPKGVEVAGDFPQDFYFLVDRSGSMAGAKWQRTCEALRAFVGLLGADDRVWITLFESDYRDFAEAPMPAPAVLADRGFQQMEAMGIGGGTELLPAAVHVLKQIARHSAERRTSVVLITDGQVGNDRGILELFQQTTNVRVHTFGIDTAVNDAFLQSLACQQRGGCWLQTPDDDIAGTIAALGDRLRRPVLTNISFGGSWEAGRASWSDLHAHEVVTVSLRGPAIAPLEITGRFPDGSEHRFAINLDSAGSEAVKLLWAKERIAMLFTANQRAEAIALARQHNLICEGAAFIAWDEAEQVAVAEEEIIQPAMQPSYAPSLLSRFKCKAVPMLDSLGDDLDTSFGDIIACRTADLSPSLRGLPRLREQPAHGAPVEADPIRHLAFRVRESFQGHGVPEPIIEAWIVWGQSQGGDSTKRLTALRAAAALISQMQGALHGPILRDRLEYGIRQALSGPAEALLHWADEARAAFLRIRALERKLQTAETPEELIDHLLAWVVESGRFDQGRLEKIEFFVETLNPLPFSAGWAVSRWRAFLELTAGVDSKAYAIACRWLPDLAVPAGERSVSALA